MGMGVNKGTPTMSFVLYTINVKCMCDASYVTLMYIQNRRYYVFYVNKPGFRFNSSGTPLFTTKNSKNALSALKEFFSGF